MGRLASFLVLPLVLSACLPDFTFDDPAAEDPASAPEPEDFGAWLSMDTAPDNKRFVLAYYDRQAQPDGSSDGALGFAIGTPQDDGTVSWYREQVDGYNDSTGIDTGNRGQYASLKVTSAGTVWITSYDVKRGALRYAYRPSGPAVVDGKPVTRRANWVVGDIDVGAGLPGSGTWTSLELDANDNPVVAYHSPADGIVKVATLAQPVADLDDLAAISWTVEEVWQGQPFTGEDADGNTVFREAQVGEFARLLIEESGAWYIAFYDRAARRLSLVTGQPGSWQHQFVTPEGADMGQWPSMAIQDGTLHIAFHDVGNQDLVVASRTGQGWTLDTVDAGEFVGADTEIFVRNGRLSVVYFDGQNNDMKLAEKTGALWVASTLGGSEAVNGTETAVGFHNEVARIGESWWAASYDYTTRKLFITNVDAVAGGADTDAGSN